MAPKRSRMERRPPATNPQDALKQLLVRLTFRTREKLKAFAAKDERSQSLIVERALTFYFQHHKPDDAQGLAARLRSIDVETIDG